MITFTIPTNIKSDEQKVLLNNLIHSIESQSVHVEHEILVCGNFEHDRVRTIEFPEDLNGTAYITRKQNLLVDNAKYENIVILRDYEELWSDWVDGFLYWQTRHNIKWTIMMSPILNKDRNRWRDVCHFGSPDNSNQYLPPYDEFDSRYCYINGGYFVAKTKFLKENKWDESLQWGQAEDVNMSLRMRIKDDFVYAFNPYSVVQLQQYKDRILPIKHSEYFGSFEYVMSKYRRDNE